MRQAYTDEYEKFYEVSSHHRQDLQAREAIIASLEEALAASNASRDSLLRQLAQLHAGGITTSSRAWKPAMDHGS